MKDKLKRSILYCDIFIWSCFVMMLAVKFMTIFMFVQIHQDTGAEIESVAVAYEANDIFRLALSMGKIGVVIEMIIMPAGLMAYYYLLRRKVLHGKLDINTLMFFVQFIFFALVINVINDGAGLIGGLMK